MPGFLKQATAGQARALGPFIDDTDFKSPATGLTIANTDIKLVINGAASADKNSGGGTHRVNGVYGVTFDATDTATVGEMEVSVNVAGALVVFDKFFVVEEVVYAALFAASSPGYLQPTTAGRTLLVDAAGNADARLADAVAHGGTLGLSTATLALSRLNVTSQTADTVAITATGNGTGSGIVATSGTGATGNGITATSAATNGNGLSATGNGTGDGLLATGGAGAGGDGIAAIAGGGTGLRAVITGTLSGSVGSISANGISATSFTAGAIDATAIAANAVGASEIAADAILKIAAGVWQDTVAGNFTVAASIGKSVMNGVALGTGLTVARCTLTDTLTTYTGNTPQTGDTFALANGANGFVAIKTDTAAILVDTGTTLDGKIDTIDTNVDAILVDTTEIGAAGAGLTALASAANLATVDTVVDAIKLKTDALPEGLKTNTAHDAFPFDMVLSADHVTPATGLTITATRSIDGGAFAACANAAVEVGAGSYVIDLEATDLNGSFIIFKFASATADTTTVNVLTNP